MTRSDGIVAFISSLPGSSGLTTENAVQAISVASEAASCISRDPKQEKIARVQLIISERARFHIILEGSRTATFSSSDCSCTISHPYRRSTPGIDSRSQIGSQSSLCYAMMDSWASQIFFSSGRVLPPVGARFCNANSDR
jgi:hypothetical protein